MSNNYVNKYADFINGHHKVCGKCKKSYGGGCQCELDEALGHVHEAELEEAFADIHEAISNSLLEDYDVSDITEEEFDDYVLDVIAEMVENSDELLESEDLQENAGLAVLRFLARKINPGRLSTSKKITAVKTPKRDWRELKREKAKRDAREREKNAIVRKHDREKAKRDARFYRAQDLRGVNTPTRADAIKTTTEQLRQLKKLRKLSPRGEALTSKLEQELKALKAPRPSFWQQLKDLNEEYGDDAPKAKRGRPSKDEGDVEHPFQQVRTAHTKGRVQGDHIRITHPSTNANKMIHKDDVKAYYNKYVNSQKPAQKEQCTSDFLAKHFGAEMTRAQMLKHY